MEPGARLRVVAPNHPEALLARPHAFQVLPFALGLLNFDGAEAQKHPVAFESVLCFQVVKNAKTS